MLPIKIALLELGYTRPELHEPLGITTIAGYLNNKYRNRIIVDEYASSFGWQLHSARDLASYDIVGIGAKLGTLHRLRDAYCAITANNTPQNPTDCSPWIVIGDVLGTFAHDELLMAFPSSIVVRGEGEIGMDSIIQGYLTGLPRDCALRGRANVVFKCGHEIVCESMEVLHDLSVVSSTMKFAGPSVDLRAQVQIEGSRGCPWSRCSFCSIPTMAGNGWRPIPIQNIVAQLEALSTVGAMSPYFTDADFLGSSVDRALKLAGAISGAKSSGHVDPNMNFYINLSVPGIIGGNGNTGDKCKQMLRSLQLAGLREVFVGVESGSNDQVSRYSKQSTRNRNIEALRTLAFLGLQADIGFMMFDPYSRLEEILDNLDFLEQTGLWSHPSRCTKAMRIQPGTSYCTKLFPNDRPQLNVNNLTYPYRFADERVERVYARFREWECGHLGFSAAVQGAAKGEVDSEMVRCNIRSYLGAIRRIDLEVLRAQSLAEVSEGLDSAALSAYQSKKRREIVALQKRVPYPVVEHCWRLNIDFRELVETSTEYAKGVFLRGIFEEPVDLSRAIS